MYPNSGMSALLPFCCLPFQGIILLFGFKVARTWDDRTKVIQNRSNMDPKSVKHGAKIAQGGPRIDFGTVLGGPLAPFWGYFWIQIQSVFDCYLIQLLIGC